MSILTNEERIELGLVPCGCIACDGSVQQGHFACEAPPAWALELERQGRIFRHYDGGAWVWGSCDIGPRPVATVRARVGTGSLVGMVVFTAVDKETLDRVGACAARYGRVMLDDNPLVGGYVAVSEHYIPQEVADYLNSIG